MRTDLHLHSSFSDGNWRPCELVEYAIDFGMDVISITDHDTIAGVEPAIAAAGDRLKVIPGIELSATLNGACDIHILGYFIDPTNSELLQAIDRLAAVRIEHTQRLLHKLRASGLNISMDDVLAFSKEGSIGKAHVTKAIVKAGGAPDITSAYNKFLCPRAQFFERRRWLDACEAICLVRKSGGIASLAHPGSYDRAFEIVEALSNQGLDALEVYHPMHDPASIEIFKGQAYQFGLHVTGGSDCHGPYEEHPPSLGSMELPSYIVQELDGLVASRV